VADAAHEPEKNPHPKPLFASEQDKLRSGPVAEGLRAGRGPAFRVSGDPLLRGAVLNGVQFAPERLKR
jgi:hypothetical protein